jgi:hypothetical protein
MRKTLFDVSLDLQSIVEGKIERHLIKNTLSEIQDAIETDDNLQAREGSPFKE